MSLNRYDQKAWSQGVNENGKRLDRYRRGEDQRDDFSRTSPYEETGKYKPLLRNNYGRRDDDRIYRNQNRYGRMQSDFNQSRDSGLGIRGNENANWETFNSYTSRRDNYGSQSVGTRGYAYRNRARGDFQKPVSRLQKSNEPELTSEERKLKIEKRLKDLENVEPIEAVRITESQWSVKPKGFEDVSAQRAKLSGLFPLPGYPRPVDFTKLEGVVKDRLLNNMDILKEDSRIDPIDSRMSKTILVKNNFEKISYFKVVEYLNNFLRKVDVKEREVQCVENKRKSTDDQLMVLEFKHSVFATIVLALNELQLPLSLFEEESNSLDNNGEVVLLHLERPQEYIVQALPKYDSKPDEIESEVKDSPRKITILVSNDNLESSMVEMLQEICPLKGFKLLREVGTKQSLGIAFIEFYIDPKLPNTETILELQSLIENLKEKEWIKNAFFSCISPDKTSIQECQTDFSSLRALVKNEFVTAHPKLRVIQLINLVTAKDLIDDLNFKFIEEDVRSELSKFGQIVSIRIPRPANDYTPGLTQFIQPGLGKIFVEFEHDEAALNAIMGTAGRNFNDRTVICAYYDYDDYRHGIL
ncbi:uncharacterized protein PRCAT00001241001 [Priceomyces carsonii]|uniref:uncharacterized protein n=1 Tax=Priceomyces carsonii TaxID=28549 RepID=UPI002EDAC5E3|nr:unnamed protein product [Priceomyces carsonii]